MKRIAVAVVLPLVLLACPLPAPAEPGGADAGVPLADAEKAFKKAIKSKDAKLRALAFDPFRRVRDLRVFEVIKRGVDTVKDQRRDIEKLQQKLQDEFASLWNDKDELDGRLARSHQTERDFKAYNKAMRKITGKMDDTRSRQQSVENQFAQNESLLQQAALVTSEILGGLDPEDARRGVKRLEDAWLHSKDPSDRVRFVYAVWQVDQPFVSELLLEVLADEERQDDVRIASMNALAAKGEVRLLEHAVKMLDLPPERFNFTAAAIRALRRLHMRSGIEPLIAFLGREDLARLRTDARDALVSLTSEEHGPYQQPWSGWWEGVKDGFEMPPRPLEPGQFRVPEAGGTFYGIHSFSDRVLLIVDISGSMDKAQPGRKGKTKMEVAQEQMIGFVYGLPPAGEFNVILFNHQVERWQSRNQTSDERGKAAAKEWIAARKPVGGTNIYDALEEGFKIAHRISGRPALDTIFFLTDGKPTAGKIRDPALILAQVAEWNATAGVTIHCVGIGKDHDAEFMKALARIGDGQYEPVPRPAAPKDDKAAGEPAEGE